ncbi:MAG TPA: ribonuclease P protein component [Candidatus Acidoferrales bacterium]
MPHAARKGATPSRASDPPRLDLPRETRLIRRAEYDAVYREGRRRSSREFTLFVRPNGLEVSRFGWSIKKALGNAVKRNRIRRRLREIFRLHRREIAAGWDIVVHPKTTVATAEFAALEQEMLKLLNFPGAPSRTAVLAPAPVAPGKPTE